MFRVFVGLVIGLSLTACEQAAFDNMLAQAPVSASEAITVTASRAQQASSENSAVELDDLEATRLLAYEYDITLWLPGRASSMLMAAHEQACHDAGPSICVVLSSYYVDLSDGEIDGVLKFSAVKSYMDDFRHSLPSDVEQAEGVVSSSAATVEDLTRTIIDTEANLSAQKTLRDRLVILLERDDAELGDLLKVERELARVQGEIDSTESYLRTLRGRVNRDLMTVSYSPLYEYEKPSPFAPLTKALGGVVAAVASSLAAVILFIAKAIPWLLLAVPGIWLGRRFVLSFFRRG